ncbi:hypothetical protein [Sediminibacterium sp. C3]|uniref:hypothetical protein n=1 Tax=Sediminibacterium sp. C3 TaxID=1267211 RepID=UPI000429A365|nr:hypothetical protein [Sediminibacterium sp. C3]
MNYEIVEIEPFSGSASKVYSIIPEGEEKTLFDSFLEEHSLRYKTELKEILKRLKQIGHSTGARVNFFKPEGDSVFVKKWGEYVYALYDEEESNLRLYCIRFSNVAVILGGGGFKDKSIRQWQEDPKLSNEVRLMMAYAESILKQLDEKELYWSVDGKELEGNLKNYDNDEED